MIKKTKKHKQKKTKIKLKIKYQKKLPPEIVLAQRNLSTKPKQIISILLRSLKGKLN